eukprot:gene9991-2166_t
MAMTMEKLKSIDQKIGAVAFTRQQSWDKTTSNIQELKEMISKCRGQVIENPSKAKHILKSTRTNLKRVCKAVSREHKCGMSEVSELASFVDKSFESSISVSSLAKPDAFSSTSTHLHRAIGEHLLREGYFNAFQAFMQESGSIISPDCTDAFKSLHEVNAALLQGNLEPLEAWLKEHHEEVTKPKYASLIAEYCKMRFIHLAGEGKNPAAFHFGKQYMDPLFNSHKEEFQKAIRSFIYGPDCKNHPDYKFYFTETAWSNISHVFLQTACAMINMRHTSPLATAVTTGCAGVSVLLKWSKVIKATNKKSQWYDEEVLPACIPLESTDKGHSIFVCPVSKSAATRTDPPVLLTCGHAICKASAVRPNELRLLNCPYCPKKMHPSDLIEMHFV